MNNANQSFDTINYLVDTADFDNLRLNLLTTSLTLNTSEAENKNKASVCGAVCKSQVMATVDSSINGNAVKLTFPASLEFDFNSNETSENSGSFDVSTLAYKQSSTNDKTGRIVIVTDDVHSDKLALLAQALDVKYDVGIPMPAELERLMVINLNTVLLYAIHNRQELIDDEKSVAVADVTKTLATEAMEKALSAFTALVGK